jgi:hypothetical protein
MGIGSKYGIRIRSYVFMGIKCDNSGGAEASVNHVVEESFP